MGACRQTDRQTSPKRFDICTARKGGFGLWPVSHTMVSIMMILVVSHQSKEKVRIWMFVSEVTPDEQLTLQMLSKVFLKVEKYFWLSYMQAKEEHLHGFFDMPRVVKNSLPQLSETRDASYFTYK